MQLMRPPAPGAAVIFTGCSEGVLGDGTDARPKLSCRLTLPG